MERGEQAQTPTIEELQVGPEGPETDTDPQLEPRIYVASLSDYNAGMLHGTWIDAWQEPDEIQDAIAGMLRTSPTDNHAEEWAIHDFEDFNGLHLGEWENLEHVSKVAKGIREHGFAYAHWATIVCEDDELDQFEDAYLGHWDNSTAYAEDVLADLGLGQELSAHVSENLRPYVRVDAEGFARDLQIGGDISVVEGDGGVYIFSNR